MIFFEPKIDDPLWEKFAIRSLLTPCVRFPAGFVLVGEKGEGVFIPGTSGDELTTWPGRRCELASVMIRDDGWDAIPLTFSMTIFDV
jgi:hypothetical protein